MTRLIRNVGIGAAFCSYRALFAREWVIFLLLLAMGAAAGALYTAVEPAVRSRPRLHYLPWILSMYLVLFGGVGVAGVLEHDQDSIDVLTNPWFIGFGLIAGAIGAYATARMFEDKTEVRPPL